MQERSEMLLDEAEMLNLDCNGDTGDARIIRHLPRRAAMKHGIMPSEKLMYVAKLEGQGHLSPLKLKIQMQGMELEELVSPWLVLISFGPVLPHQSAMRSFWSGNSVPLYVRYSM